MHGMNLIDLLVFLTLVPASMWREYPLCSHPPWLPGEATIEHRELARDVRMLALVHTHKENSKACNGLQYSVCPAPTCGLP